MKSVFLLLLCLSLVVGEGQTEASVPQRDGVRTQVDVPLDHAVLWDELQGLKELVLSLKAVEVGQRQSLRSMESRLRDGKVEAEQQKRSVDALQEMVDQHRKELRSAELRTETDRKLVIELNVKVGKLEEQSKALAGELPFLQMRLRASETTVEQLRRKSAVLAVRLCHSESVMKELRRQTASNSSSDELNSNTRAQSADVPSMTDSRTEGEQQLNELQTQRADSQSAGNDSQTTVVSSLSALEVRLSITEEQLEDLKKVNTVQQVGLLAVTVRLNSSEEDLDLLKTQNTELEVRQSASEKQLEDLKKENTELEVRQSASEKQLEDLKKENTELEVRHSVSEKQLEDLKKENTELEVRQSASEKQLEYLKKENTELEVRHSVSEKQLEDLKKENTELEVRHSVSEKQLEDLKKENTELEVRHSVSEKQLEDLKKENTELEVRQSASEKQLEDLKKENTELEVRHSVSEKQLEDLKKENTELEVRQSASEKQLEYLKKENTELEVRHSVSEKQLEDLKKENTALSFRLNESFDRSWQLTNTNSDELKVAFSAGLTDSGPVGPFDEERTLIFSKVISNIGQAYNQTAGVFTAPVRGLYFFSFTAADYQKGYMGLHLYRNNQPIIFNLDLNAHGGYASTSNGVALQLEAGDGVHLSLPASYRLYDDVRNFSVFSGFLLFPL
uniref:myosin heavy chain, clone 203-like n=1 Tax=Semicossyphus pulcher TaxID=241346 RepID=UPI0037E77612